MYIIFYIWSRGDKSVCYKLFFASDIGLPASYLWYGAASFQG